MLVPCHPLQDGKFKVKELSDDQKPDRPDERARILGKIPWPGLARDVVRVAFIIPALMA